MTFPELLQFLAPVLIGAVIGVFTNYIAVKMLFRPFYPHYIGSWQIPFTPGIIPRRQGALARALGQMVSASLVRKEELAQTLLSDSFMHFVAKSVLSIPDLRAGVDILLSGKYEQKREDLLDAATDKIIEGLRQMDIGGVIVAEGKNAAAELGAKNPLVRMFLTDSKIDAMAEPIGERVEAFLAGEGRTRLRTALEAEIATQEERPIADLFGGENAEKLIADACRRLLAPHLVEIASHFHIAEMVEEKVNAMRPEDLEKLVVSVMKKELTAVIWLGGLIGLILGAVNLLIRNL